MRTISNWARIHPVYARILIILFHLLGGLIAYFLAKEMFDRGIILPGVISGVLIFLFFVAVLLYPDRIRGVKKSSWQYARQKSCDFLLAFCGFGLACFFCNRVMFNQLPIYQSVRATMIIEKPLYKHAESKTLLDALKSGERKSKDLTRKEKRIQKDEFKYQLVRYADAKLHGDKAKSGDAGLIILAILGAGLLLYLVAALACNLSCNGSDAAALIVGILGTAGIIIGLIAVIHAIKRKGRKKEEADKTM